MTIKIFLSSSRELKSEREKIGDFVSGLNSKFEKNDISVLLEKWEYADKASTLGRKQDEYLAKLKQCDRCVVLFWNIVGKYTDEELKEALAEQEKGENPKKVYILFKFDEETELEQRPEVNQLYQDYMSRARFVGNYNNIECLKLNFLEFVLEALKPYINTGNCYEIDDGMVKVNDKAYVKLDKLSCFYKNDHYNTLLDTIKLLQRLNELDDNGSKSEKVLCGLKDSIEKKTKLEERILDLCLSVDEKVIEKGTYEYKKAAWYLRNGNYEAAEALMKENEYNLNKVKNEIWRKKLEMEDLLQERREMIKNYIEYKKEGWKDEVVSCYEIAIEKAKDNVDHFCYLSWLFEYASFLCDNELINERVLSVKNEALGLIKYLQISSSVYDNWACKFLNLSFSISRERDAVVNERCQKTMDLYLNSYWKSSSGKFELS